MHPGAHPPAEQAGNKIAHVLAFFYSTVTDFARFLGWSTSFPRYSAM